MKLLGGTKSDVLRTCLFCSRLVDEKEIEHVDLVEDRTHNQVIPMLQKKQKLQASLLNSHTRRNPSASNLGISGS